MMQTRDNEVEILLVEDSPADVRLTIEALKEAKVVNRMNVVGNGAKAMDYLFKRGAYTTALRPDLILLDLNLPGKDGREVLQEIKVDPDLRRIPVVVLTTSQAEEDVLRAYNSHCNCYISKPLDFHQFTAAVKSIETFWLTIVRLPPR
jgi:two-component system, chemotaxis family, response regulator Rcp1